MKKKIIFLAIFSFLFYSNVSAQETEIPTDAEIMEIINKYNFTQSQKDYLLKEAKKKIEESFASGEIEKTTNQQKTQTQASQVSTKKRGIADEHSFRAVKQRREQAKKSAQ